WARSITCHVVMHHQEDKTIHPYSLLCYHSCARNKRQERIWMQKEFITQMLGIKEKYIAVNHLEITNNVFQVELSTKVRTVACPKCKHKTRHIHGYRNQCIQGRRIEEKPVVLHLRKRRYKCINCG